MTDSKKGRMLLSHNFNISDEIVPKLNREEFAKIFMDFLVKYDDIICSAIDNPHWIVEILFDPENKTPTQVGEICTEALLNKRKSEKKSDSSYSILALGGVKTTPATSSSPSSLQQGQWGVDVVETPDGQIFLQGLGWEVITASKPAENIFQVEVQI